MINDPLDSYAMQQYEMNKYISVARLVAVLDANGDLMTSVLLDGASEDGPAYTMKKTLDEETNRWGEPVTVELRGCGVDMGEALPLMLRIGEAIVEETRRLMELRAARKHNDF